MIKHLFILSSVCLLMSANTPVFSEEKANEQQTPAPTKQQDIGKISEAFGHLISKNIETTGVQFDIASDQRAERCRFRQRITHV